MREHGLNPTDHHHMPAALRDRAPYGDASRDGVHWLAGGTVAQTFTPTYVGFHSSSYGTSTKSIASYEFLRRVSGVT
jgi:hypothetical protein